MMKKSDITIPVTDNAANMKKSTVLQQLDPFTYMLRTSCTPYGMNLLFEDIEQLQEINAEVSAVAYFSKWLVQDRQYKEMPTLIQREQRGKTELPVRTLPADTRFISVFDDAALCAHL
jgi:hypothetical protein